MAERTQPRCKLSAAALLYTQAVRDAVAAIEEDSPAEERLRSLRGFLQTSAVLFGDLAAALDPERK